MVPFHLAFPVRDLAETRAFYHELLGCPVGRESARWIDFDFFGHQITAHLADGSGAVAHNEVDSDAVPVPHFGAVLTMDDWQSLADRLTKEGVRFVIEPHIRFKGEVGEQATMFIKDPSGNALEFKAVADHAQLFAR
jgi:extradiol dioxygenase family protein